MAQNVHSSAHKVARNLAVLPRTPSGEGFVWLGWLSDVAVCVPRLVTLIYGLRLVK